GLELLDRALAARPELCCVVVADAGREALTVEAMERGAEDFLTRPLSPDAAALLLERIFERLGRLNQLAAQLEQRRAEEPRRIIGNSGPVVDLMELVEQVAPSRATVLITGESGTGKELVARMLHERSRRSDGPFIKLHCAALAETLLESELFGHEKGSFTGAIGQRRGRFEEAHGGTLFLDEIGEVPPSIQVKLLRVIQERAFERVGGNQTVQVDVRLIAATHRDLKAEARAGRFREDLYYRLNVIHLNTPPLRERRGDIPLLIRHFLTHYAEENDKALRGVTPAAMALLERYAWPGNIRELENAIERAVVLTRGDEVDVRHLPPDLREEALGVTGGIPIPGSRLADIERYAILKTWEATGTTARTAEVLGISVRKVRYKLKEYGSPVLGEEKDEEA
ncbi:MAG: transcriptional regulator, partial [Myxococcales bacterium]|nr:transcriptional regulator [Myxococcales bacterium]